MATPLTFYLLSVTVQVVSGPNTLWVTLILPTNFMFIQAQNISFNAFFKIVMHVLYLVSFKRVYIKNHIKVKKCFILMFF